MTNTQSISSWIHRVAVGVLMLSLVVGPLCVGSYFGGWRWPLVWLAGVAAVLMTLAPVRRGRDRGMLRWLLLLALILLAAQGLWMWYNCWGVLVVDAGSGARNLKLLESIPYPDLPGGADRAEAWDRLSYLLPCLGLVWGTRRLVSSYPWVIKWIAKAIFWTGTAVALLGLVQRWTAAEGIFWSESLSFKDRTLFFGTYRSPGIASAYLNITLALGLSLILTWKRRGEKSGWQIAKRLAHATSLIVIFCGVMEAGSKAGMVFGLLTVLLWVLLNARSISKGLRNLATMLPGGSTLERNIIVVVFSMIIVLSGLSFSNTVMERWQDAHESGYSTLDERAKTNALQFKMMNDPEWGALGFGVGSFYPLFHYFDKANGDVIKGTMVYAHNDHLQTLVEWGWFGGALFVFIIGGGGLLLVLGIYVDRTRYARKDVILMRGCTIALLVLLLHATVDFPFQIESIAVTFSVLLGVAWRRIPAIKAAT